MLKQDKKEPAYVDLDKIWFGKYKDILLQDVPASYLSWIFKIQHEKGINKWKIEQLDVLQIKDLMLFNYIFNSKEALKQEYPDFFY